MPLREPPYHPAQEIEGTKVPVLSGRRIAFGLTGSVAIYRSVDVMRELIRRGAEVYAVLSEAATELVRPALIEWATGSKAFTSFAGETGHVALGRTCDSMVIAPATADILSKIAHGICDNPVSLTAVDVLGLGKPLIVAPAMHRGLWKSPPVVETIKKLEEFGVTIIPPVSLEGKAKYPSTEDVVAAVEAITLRGRDLRGLRMLVAAGPTREYLDNVRFISNPSSGRMGIAVAREAFFRGAQVTLVHGPLSVGKPHYIRSVGVETTEEMLQVIVGELSGNKYDVIVMAAAPADFRFGRKFSGKVRTKSGSITITLEPTPKIAAEVRKRFKGLLVGFAAECVAGDLNALAEAAQHKMRERGFDIIVANDVCAEDSGFATETNEVLIIVKGKEPEHVKLTLKSEVARRILDAVRDEVYAGGHDPSSASR